MFNCSLTWNSDNHAENQATAKMQRYFVKRLRYLKDCSYEYRLKKFSRAILTAKTAKFFRGVTFVCKIIRGLISFSHSDFGYISIVEW